MEREIDVYIHIYTWPYIRLTAFSSIQMIFYTLYTIQPSIDYTFICIPNMNSYKKDMSQVDKRATNVPANACEWDIEAALLFCWAEI